VLITDVSEQLGVVLEQRY